MNQKLVALVVLTLCFAHSMAQAADRYAAPVAVGLGNGSSWANAGTLLTAVTGATAGCTVWVSNGVYTLTAPIVVTNFTIKSFGANGAVDRDGTIIDGSGARQCFSLTHTNAVVEGLTITNGFVSSASSGGGVSIANGTLRNCLVIKCTAGLGGGIYATGAKSVVTNCDIIANTANSGAFNDGGGGVRLVSGAQVWNSRIANNSAVTAGSAGGAYVNGGSLLLNCTIVSNTAAGSGSAGYGGVLIISGTLRNCLIFGNTGNNGAGVGTIGGSPTIENCTIVKNNGNGLGSNYSLASYTLRNTIVYYNTAPDVNPNTNTIVAYNCCLSSTGKVISGSGNITASPAFMSQNGDYRLAPWSRGVDQGSVLAWMSTATDLAGQPRISANNLPDMGAYETTAGSPSFSYYVARRGQTPVIPYTNGWGSAASNIQDVLSVMSDGVTVLVTNGLYPLENQIVVGYATVRSFNNGAVDRDGTIIDANNYVGKSVTNRCFALTHADSRVEGFTITNGSAPSASCLGGGVNMSDGVLNNCLVTGNHVTNNVAAGAGQGGGVYATGSSIITNCDIIGNKIWYTGSGGGVYLSGTPKIWNSRIRNNGTPTTTSTSGALGAGIFINNAGPTVWNSVISGNWLPPYYTGNNGGGVQMWSGGSLFNCLITGNGANSGAGVSVAGGGGMAYIENCTVAGNTAGYHGAIAMQYAGGSVAQFALIRNTICYSNITDVQIYHGHNITNSLVTNSCVTATNNLVGGGNITNNPQFVNYAGGNLQLLKTSLCINTGTNQVWMTGALDLVGAPRLDWRDGLVDMGAYEYVPLRPSGTLMMIR
jgi:hypothetical protein